MTRCGWLLWALLLSGLGAGCPTEPVPDPPAPQPVHQYLAGTSQYTGPTGQEAPAARVLIHRVLDPTDDTLLEDVHQQASATTWDHYEVNGDIEPDTGAFTLAFFDGYGTFEGVGTLTAGAPWAWTAWESRSEYVDGPYVGSYVLSEDTLDDDGLRAVKQIFSPDDHAEGSVLELLEWTDAAAWQAEVDAISD